MNDICNDLADQERHRLLMATETILALSGFAFVTSITPGPNNLMLMASGANFGFRRTLPHMLGVGIGFMLMLVLVGIGLAGVFDRFPPAYTVLKGLSVAYLVFLAVKIANAAPPGGEGSQGEPMTFLQAAAFQWVNPKAWAMALTAVTVYAPDRGIYSILLVTAVFGAINLPAVGSWTLLGQQMRHFLTSQRRLRAFNITMAVLLIATLYPVLRP